MVSKSQIKLITSLVQKKYRYKSRLFIVEGKKSIIEFLNSDLKLEKLYTTVSGFDAPEAQTEIITETELKKISQLKTPQTALALFVIPECRNTDYSGLILALDDVRDPGNLGTIIRLCDWFGIETLVCSKNTADAYNPKVVQASMGSLSRVKIFYRDLNAFISENELPVFGAFMNAENVYQTKLPKKAVLVMGNEANGISPEILVKINRQISIPAFGVSGKTESLNVATATAILLSEFRRS